MRVRIKVYGLVQGVFFRANARERAYKLGLRGWIRNNEDGGVEILAEGRGEAVQKLVEWCKLGPGMARVDKVEITEEEPEEKLGKFKIVY